MQQVAAAPPAPRGGTGGGQAPAGDSHHRGRPVRDLFRAPGHVLDPDPPAARRRLPRHGDVTAQPDQHPAADRLSDAVGGAVGGPGFGRRAEVQPGPGRHGQRARGRVQVDLAPPGYGPDGQIERRPVRGDQAEVTVVASRRDRFPDRRVDVAVGELRGAQRHRHRHRQQRAQLDGPAIGAVQRDELGIGPEPAARGVQLGQVGRQHRPCRFEYRGVRHHEMHPAAERRPARRRRGVLRRPGFAPLSCHRDLRRKPRPSGRAGIWCPVWLGGVLSVMTGIL